MLTKFGAWPGQRHDPYRSIRRLPPSRDLGAATCGCTADLACYQHVFRLLPLAEVDRCQLSDGTATEQNRAPSTP